MLYYAGNNYDLNQIIKKDLPNKPEIDNVKMWQDFEVIRAAQSNP